MPVTIRAQASIMPGCRLYYDCPSMGGSFQADAFFDKYGGKYAEFVSYCEKLIGPLDILGRIPGRYIDQEAINVRFKGEDVVHKSLNIRHFVVCDSNNATLAENADNRIGDLLNPVVFYPDDQVTFYKRPEDTLTFDSRPVQSVALGDFIAPGGIPRYQVSETEGEQRRRLEQKRAEEASKPADQRLFTLFGNRPRCWFVDGQDLAFVSRGNVWALYRDPSKLSFASDETELEFWTRNGISQSVTSSSLRNLGQMARALASSRGLELSKAYEIFAAEEADLIQIEELRNRGEGIRYTTRRLHACFSAHRVRVRALTERLWSGELKKENSVA